MKIAFSTLRATSREIEACMVGGTLRLATQKATPPPPADALDAPNTSNRRGIGRLTDTSALPCCRVSVAGGETEGEGPRCGWDCSAICDWRPLVIRSKEYTLGTKCSVRSRKWRKLLKSNVRCNAG